MCYAAYALDCLCTYQSDKQAPSRRHQCCAMQRGRRVNFRWLVSVIHKLVGHNTITRIFDCRSHIQTCFRVQVQNPSLLASGTSLQGKCSHTHTHTHNIVPQRICALATHTYNHSYQVCNTCCRCKGAGPHKHPRFTHTRHGHIYHRRRAQVGVSDRLVSPMPSRGL